MVWDNQDDNFLPNWGQPGQLGEGLSHYPTDFTRDVVPIPCHSHNDYWRRVPLFEAIHYGCTGVEADVWLFDDELFVGHNLGSLTKNRTLRKMYIDPLLDILDHQNPSTPFNNSSRQGVFDEDQVRHSPFLLTSRPSARPSGHMSKRSLSLSGLRIILPTTTDLR